MSELKPPRFPTMLRKMWSGAEVQAWIDEEWNRRAQPVAQAEGVTAIGDSRCFYLSSGICNKCGRTHDGKPNPGLAFGAAQPPAEPAAAPQPATDAEPVAQPRRTMIDDFIVCIANAAIQAPDASVHALLGMMGYVRQPPRPEPLTDAEIEDCIDSANRKFNGRRQGPCGQQMTTYDDWKYWLAREVEAAIRAQGEQ